MGGTVRKYAAHDARTGQQIGESRYTVNQAQKDADKATKKGTEAVVRPVGELRG